MKPWKRDLSDLTLGPYDGYGGLRRLADDLGVKATRVRAWMNDDASPSPASQEALRALAESYRASQRRS